MHPLFKLKKNEYSVGYFALKLLHYICVNFDTHKLAHTWKCHALSISLCDIVPEKYLSCSAGYLCINKYQNNSGKVFFFFFIMYRICEINVIFVSSNSESQERR